MTFGRLGVLGSLGKLYGGDVGGGAFSWANAEGAAFEAQADGTGWDDTLRGDIDQLISDLKSGQVNGSNTYGGFDRILLMDLPNQPDSLRYLNAPTLTATAVNSPIFTATEGFTFDGSTNYVDSNYNPVDDGAQYVQNSASFMVWVRTAATVGSPNYTGARGASCGGILWADGRGYSGRGPNANNFFLDDASLSRAQTMGFLGRNRSSSLAVQSYIGNLQNASNTAASSLSISGGPDFYIGADNRGSSIDFASAQISAWFAGRSFTANEWADIYDAFNRYRTAREAA